MSHTTSPASTEAATTFDIRAVIRVTLGVIALLTIVLAAFAGPMSDLKPRSLPLAVAAPTSDQVDAVETQLANAFGEDGVEVLDVVGRDDALRSIEDREVYGAIVVGGDAPEILTATAASPMVAQLLDQVAQQMAAEQDGPPPSAAEVVPAAEGDPRGTVFAAAALPLALGGLLAGALPALLLSRIRDRIAAAVCASAGAGLALTGVLQGWFDALGGNYWANASVIALGVLAVALPIIGFHRLLGRPGIAVMALVVMLVGNPLSGIASAPEMLPLGWLGQLLPPGAAGTALRGTAFFEGVGAGVPLTTLACWASAGLALTLAGALRRRAPSQ